MLILALILFGMIAGAAAQLLLGKPAGGIDWSLAFGAGLVGSFVGGLLFSLLAGDGVELRASGLIGSIVGAVIVTAGWLWFKRREEPPPTDLGLRLIPELCRSRLSPSRT